MIFRADFPSNFACAFAAMDQVNAAKGGSRSGNLGNGVSYLKGRGGG